MTYREKWVTARLSLRIASGLVAARLAKRRGVADRLGDIPADGLPLGRPVRIHWDSHAIPFIEADSDTDAAVALGMVHAHLRLGQIEIFRRIAAGRMAEMLGPAAFELDHGLRLLGFDKAVAGILAMMPADTRAWTEAFAAGISHYVAHTPRLPPEFAWLGIGREPWSIADILGIGRLAAADVNWMILFNLVRLRARPDWPELWAAIADHEGAAFQGNHPLAAEATQAARSGSNALAIAGRRSASGAALMAADPHLNLTLPNLWLAAVIKAPGLHAGGLMIPGLPFIAIGRNPAIAWSGSALQSASSDLFDARRLPAHSRTIRLRCRLEPDRDALVRDTPLGPLISDAALLGCSHRLALKWVGHSPSDELSGWLGINRATDWAGFAAAADKLAVPGQNLLYADRTGRIGKLMAAHLPTRKPGPQADAVLDPAEAAAWRRMASSRALPSIVDPPDGILATANEQPRHADIRVAVFYSPHDRYLRLHRLARSRARLDLGDLADFQQDVYSEGAVEMKTWLARHLAPHPLAARLETWSGHYAEDSQGAAAYERMLAALHDAVHGDAGMAAYWASWNPAELLRRRLADPARATLLAAAAAASGHADWGDLHRLRLSHLLASVPFARRAGRFTDLPSAGGNETLMKTAHGIAAGRHAVRFGANARFLADLADPDRNHVVLLGGQDGWIGADAFLDQMPLWRAGEAVPLPLRPETAKAQANWHMVLTP